MVGERRLFRFSGKLRNKGDESAYNFPRLEVKGCMKKSLYAVLSLMVVVLLSAFFLPERAGEPAEKKFFGALPGLFYMEEKSIKEIETITGLPSGTIRSSLSRGRQHLKQYLEARI